MTMGTVEPTVVVIDSSGELTTPNISSKRSISPSQASPSPRPMEFINPLEKIEQLLTCPICLDRYKHPKLLPCHHSFCLPCLESYADSVHRNLKCPECRAEHPIPYDGVKSFQTNYTLTGFLDIHLEATDENAEQLEAYIQRYNLERCKVCDEKAELELCHHCDRKACKDCRTSHMEMVKRDLGRLLNQVRRLSNRVKEASESLTKGVDLITLNAETAKTEVKEYFHRYHNELKRREESFIQEIDIFLQNESRLMRTLRDVLSVESNNLTDACTWVDGVLSGAQEAKDDEIFRIKNVFTDGLEYLRNFQPDSEDFFSKKIRFTAGDDANKLPAAIANFGELTVALPQFAGRYLPLEQQYLPRPIRMGLESDSYRTSRRTEQEDRASRYRNDEDAGIGRYRRRHQLEDEAWSRLRVGNEEGRSSPSNVESIRQAHEQRVKQRHSLCIVSSSDNEDETIPQSSSGITSSATTADLGRKTGTQKFRNHCRAASSKKLTISADAATIASSENSETNDSSIETSSTPPSQPIPISYFPGENNCSSLSNNPYARFLRSESFPDLGESYLRTSAVTTASFNHPLTDVNTNPIQAAATELSLGIQEFLNLDNSTITRYCAPPARQDSSGDAPSSTSNNDSDQGSKNEKGTEQRRNRFRRRSSIVPDREISREASSSCLLSRTSSFISTPFNDYESKHKPKLMIGRRGEAEGEMTWPRGVAQLPGGEFAVCDSSNHRIQIFDLSGKLLRVFGKYGTEEGELDSCAGIAYNRYRQHLIITDRYNHRVQIFELDGKFVRQFGSYGNTNGKFNNPWGVAVDEMGMIYVADKDNHRIQVFDQNGNYMMKFGSQGIFDQNGNYMMKYGSQGSELGQFNHPLFVAIHRRTQNIFISDSANNRICVFDHDGTPILAFGIEGFHTGQLKLPRGIAVDEQGFVIVADSGNNRVQIFSPDGKFVHGFGNWGVGPGQLKGIEGVAIVDTNIVISDRENHRLQIF
uniref:RING-type domain-containing protein n=1 Tax=Panagrolaimus sp. ES5 TaxID=591445 RepID=A0AC34FQL3_9BILA